MLGWLNVALIKHSSRLEIDSAGPLADWLAQIVTTT